MQRKHFARRSLSQIEVQDCCVGRIMIRADAVLAVIGETLVRLDIFGGEAIGNSGTSWRIKLGGCSRSMGAAGRMDAA